MLPRMITAKLTSKAQTTIPQAVRHHLGLQPGDRLGFILEGERVLLVKPRPKPQAPAQSPAEPPATSPILAEWLSEADQRIFHGL